MSKATYKFSDFTVDTGLCELRHQDDMVTIEPKAFDLLCCLIENRDRTVGKDELLDRLWPGVIVSETSLTSCIKKVRRAVADSADRQAVIKTLPRRGYRFVAELDEAADPSQDLVDTAAINMARPDKPSLVVLPFATSAGDEESEILADGLAEDITADLSRNGWLFVIARSSAFSFKGQIVKGREVAEELGVRYMVEGVVRRAGDKVRVAAHLIDADTETQQWSERYDRPITDLFALQEEIAQGIATALGSEIRRAEGARAKTADPAALDAWGLMHRGMAMSWSTFNQESNAQAETLYRRAVEIAPDDARCHAFLGNCLAMKFVNGWSEDYEDDHRNAWIELRRAMDLAPDDPVVLGQIGHAHSCLGEPSQGVRLLERAIELDPNGAFALGVIAYSLTMVGRAEEAISRVQEIRRRSPRDPVMNWFLLNAGWAYLQLGDFRHCEEYCRASIDRYDGWQPPWITLGVACQAQGKHSEAISSMKSGRRLAPEIPSNGYKQFFSSVALDETQADDFCRLLEELWNRVDG